MCLYPDWLIILAKNADDALDFSIVKRDLGEGEEKVTSIEFNFFDDFFPDGIDEIGVRSFHTLSEGMIKTCDEAGVYIVNDRVFALILQ